jgi:hypothetical protein
VAKETPLKPISTEDMDPSLSGNPAGGISSRGTVTAPRKREAQVREPMQFLFPSADCKAIRIAANERGISYSDFMLKCFHDFMKNGT